MRWIFLYTIVYEEASKNILIFTNNLNYNIIFFGNEKSEEDANKIKFVCMSNFFYQKIKILKKFCCSGN